MMKQRLRIALFSYADPGVAGGVQEFTYFLAGELGKRGHRVTIFGPQGRPIRPLPNYQAVCYSLAVPTLNGNWTNITVPFARTPSVAGLINEGQFDILHIQDPWVPFVAYDLLRNTTLPKVGTFNTGWESSSAAAILATITPLFKEVISAASLGVTFVSQHVAACWQPLVPKTTRAQVIYYGIDPALQPSTPHKFSGRLLFVARLVPRKGLLHLLKALAVLVKEFPLLKLEVMGAGPEKESLANFVKKHDLGRHITFHGQVTGEEKYGYFKASDIFCAPFVDEGFPIVALEAIGAGLPVVGFKNGAFAEAFRSYPAPQLFVEPGDSDKLAHALRTLLVNQKLYNSLKAWCRKESPKYTWEKTAQEMERFYFARLKQKP